MKEGKNRRCCWSTECTIVVPRRPWRDIFLGKSGNKHTKRKTGKERPVETDAADGNPQRTRIPTAA